MYRTERKTSQWFVGDFEPQIKDREFTQNQSPGLYDSQEKLVGNQKQLSWNLGKIPFKSGEQRFKNNNHKVMFQPGPGAYNTIMAIKPASSPVNSNVQQLMSSQFMSKAPKVSIYKAEEKRI